MTQLLDKAYELVSNKYSNRQDRLNHILGVKDMAIKLANIYNVDPIKAGIAGLMHDYYKYESVEELRKIVKEEDIKKCDECNVLYHAYASSEAYLKLIGDDIDIYNAIKYHVYGRVGASLLEEIILISDYTEENRQYKNCIDCRNILFKDGLYEAIYFSTLKVIEHLESNNIKPTLEQYEILKYYEKKRNLK